MKASLTAFVSILFFVVLLLPSFSLAATQMNNKTVIHMQFFVPCAAGGAGENVDLSGPLHTMITYTINRRHVSGAFHVQPQGMHGIGETTGTKYEGTGVSEQTFTGSFRNEQNTNSFVNNFRFIGQGPGNNFVMHETLHINISADGDVTVNHDNFSFACK